MEFKKISGFDFVKIGEAYFSNKELKATHAGKSLENWKLKLKLVVNENILNAEQSAYLVLKDNTILYVGYFSNSFKERWWKKKGYFWHGDKLDNEVNALVKSGYNVTVWISVNPYIGKINISKHIEDAIIMEYADKGIINKVGKKINKNSANTLSVREILNIQK
ncbi:hypothetical protein [Rheinheimera salexigens]|uniref:GIY-YIG domain-containing protein n=1 Tax=Rheinheimera salexigens TaxID=1628148 RepID=A0A1E7Q614_9GAMM|nr:hypothetical protein [Rheinheimera salexigens]OEY69587.1 hypothetical protein BI198_08460 [Rheinheimera salexigens]